MSAVETSPCERSSFWHHFLSSFLASQYGASPVGRQILRRRCIWFLGCLSGPIFGTAERSQKWDRRLHLLSFLYNSLKTVPKTGPSGGPVFGASLDAFWWVRAVFSSLLHCNLATREALSGEAAFCGVLRSCFWDRCSISV